MCVCVWVAVVGEGSFPLLNIRTLVHPSGWDHLHSLPPSSPLHTHTQNNTWSLLLWTLLLGVAVTAKLGRGFESFPRVRELIWYPDDTVPFLTIKIRYFLFIYFKIKCDIAFSFRCIFAGVLMSLVCLFLYSTAFSGVPSPEWLQ